MGIPGGRERSDVPLRRGMGQSPAKRPPDRGAYRIIPSLMLDLSK